MSDQKDEFSTQSSDDTADKGLGIRRRTLLKAGWTLPLVTLIPLPQESAMAQSGPHGDVYGDHTDTSHTDSHTDTGGG